MQSTDPKRREDHGVVDEGLTIKMLEDLYQSGMIGVGEKKNTLRVLIMSWNQFQVMYGVNGERLRADYMVCDVNGCAQIQPKSKED